jgi:hypothetical protein
MANELSATTPPETQPAIHLHDEGEIPSSDTPLANTHITHALTIASPILLQLRRRPARWRTAPGAPAAALAWCRRPCRRRRLVILLPRPSPR